MIYQRDGNRLKMNERKVGGNIGVNRKKEGTELGEMKEQGQRQ